jgi:hypothetical protein
MEKVVFEQQSRGTAVAHTLQNEGLMHRPAREGRIRGGHLGRVTRRSYYTKAVLHPFATFAVLGLSWMAIRSLSRSLRSPLVQ